MTESATDPLDFTYLDGLACVPAGEGRLFLGRCAQTQKDRPALIFVHGGYMGAWAFTAYLRHFDMLGIHSGAVDCRGHGGLPPAPSFMTAGIVDFAHDVVAAAAHFTIPPVLLGHSLGALTVAVAMGQCAVSGLGLLAPSPPGQLPDADPVRLVPERVLRSPTARLLHGLETDASHKVRERLCLESPVALNDRYGLRVESADPIGAPAICISAGRDDPKRHPPGQDRAVGDFFGAENHILPTAPHCFMLAEDWRDSADLLAGWYDRALRVAA